MIYVVLWILYQRLSIDCLPALISYIVLLRMHVGRCLHRLMFNISRCVIVRVPLCVVLLVARANMFNSSWVITCLLHPTDYRLRCRMACLFDCFPSHRISHSIVASCLAILKLIVLSSVFYISIMFLTGYSVGIRITCPIWIFTYYFERAWFVVRCSSLIFELGHVCRLLVLRVWNFICVLHVLIPTFIC